MKKYVYFFTFLSTILLFSCQTNKPLTENEKVDDFLYLYQTLEANYPYLDLVKRKHGVDWLAKKDEYVNQVRAAATDTAYIQTINKIISDLHDGHTDLYPTIEAGIFLDTYKEIVPEYPEYKTWVKYLEKDYTRTTYWSKILMPEKPEDEEAESDRETEITSNYSDSLIADRGIAIMSVPSVMAQLIELDSAKIDQFLNNLEGVNKLIINIQGNGGGSVEYWRDLIVARLIKEPIEFAQYFAIKKGEVIKEYYAKYLDPAYELSREDPFYQKLPTYFQDDSFLIAKEVDTIKPNNPVDFNGSIYLLVDRSVFSSAEGFAYFAQLTNWATVIGQPTSGDGIGSDPIIISLPKSGIKLRFPATAGFNADGSLNSEKGTTPSQIVEGKTRAERLENFISVLK